MHQYRIRDVQKLLRLPPGTIRAFVDAGFVKPVRGARNALLFSFQDLIVLRTAQALYAANVPQRRITRAVRELRRHLPERMPLSGLRIDAVADHVVVREGSSRWNAESGQYLFGFEGDPASGALSVIERTTVAPAVAEVLPPAPQRDADWYERAVELESEDDDAAIRAYERALAADPAHVDARINLGRLLHEKGRHARAEKLYREALRLGAQDPVLLYNLAVLLDDMKRPKDAILAYRAALEADPRMADCHYNLALLYEQIDEPRDALRHMAQYRRLVRKR